MRPHVSRLPALHCETAPHLDYILQIVICQTFNNILFVIISQPKKFRRNIKILVDKLYTMWYNKDAEGRESQGRKE